MSFFDFLSTRKPAAGGAAGDTETVRKIVDALDAMEPERARYLAAFAYILSRVARADLNITAEESRAMERIVAEHGELPEEQAIIVMQIAKYQNLLFGATENFLVTREFAAISTHEQKLALLDCLFSVAAAEHLISSAEDNEIRRVAREVGLEHHDFIAVRSRHRDWLAVLQREDPDKAQD
jgi:uncharacterized tellurite resistance protein B-like protein